MSSRPLYISRNVARNVELTSNTPRQSQAASHHLTLGSNRLTTWAGRSPTNDTFPVPIHNGFPHPHPETHVPPDGWIPRSKDGSHIAIPPPHEFERGAGPPSSSSGQSWATASGIQNRINWVFGASRHVKQQSGTPKMATPMPGYRLSSNLSHTSESPFDHVLTVRYNGDRTRSARGHPSEAECGSGGKHRGHAIDRCGQISNGERSDPCAGDRLQVFTHDELHGQKPIRRRQAGCVDGRHQESPAEEWAWRGWPTFDARHAEAGG